MKRLVSYSALTLFTLSMLITASGVLHAEATISGVAEMDYTHIGTRSGKDKTDDKLTVQDVMIYVKGPVGDKAKFFSEFMVNPNSSGDEVHSAHDQSIQVERMYLSTTKLLKGHTIKAGIFQLFDGPVKSYHVATGNPLPGNVIFFKNPWAHGNTLHDVFTDAGVELSGMKGQFGYRIAGFNGMGEKTPSSTSFGDASPTGVFGKLLRTSRAVPGLQAGLSYYSADDTTDSEPVATSTANLVSDEDEYLIGELIYRRPAYRLTGLWLDGTQTRQRAGGGFDNEGDGFMVEGVYNASDNLSLVGR
ncbi:MAG: hypothetical protein ABEK50_09925, partial [bacterium]